MGEVISRSNCAHQTPHQLSCLDVGRAQNTGPTESTTEDYPSARLSGLDLGNACSPGLASDSSWWSNLEPEQCGQGGHTHPEQEQAQCG